jgi:UDP-2,4-diacetamido-2,4,6-trideoxy-beta-L-altropyranose hydrolase
MRRSVLLRPDGGSRVGMGHTGRCIALAQAFAHIGWRAVLVSGDPSARRFARANGVAAAAKPRGHWDIAVSDTYRAPLRSARSLASIAENIVVIDDLHQLSDARLLAILRPSIGERSQGNVLGGAKYVLLRREYWRRPPARRRRTQLTQVFMMLGAYPSADLLDHVRRTVRNMLPGARIDVAIGLKRGALTVVARRLARADVAIVSGGQSLNESLASRVPTIVATTAANQERQVRAATRAGAALSVGRLDAPTSSVRLKRAFALAKSPTVRRDLVRAATVLIDGRGAERTARALARAAALRR